MGQFENCPIMSFAQEKKIIAPTFQISGAMVILCPKERRETRYEIRETRNEKRETKNEKRESERIKVRVVIFPNRPGQHEKSANFRGSGTVCI